MSETDRNPKLLVGVPEDGKEVFPQTFRHELENGVTVLTSNIYFGFTILYANLGNDEFYGVAEIDANGLFSEDNQPSINHYLMRKGKKNTLLSSRPISETELASGISFPTLIGAIIESVASIEIS